MKNVVKSYVPALLAVLLIFTGRPGNVGASEPTGEKTGVIRSIFNADKSRESAVTIGTTKPLGIENNVGEIVVAEGQTVTDEGFINTFIRDEVVAGRLKYGTTTFSTSISGCYYKNVYNDIQNDPSLVTAYTDNLFPDYNSTFDVQYNLKTKTGGTTPIKYSFRGVKSTGNEYIYIYFHYYLHGIAENGQNIESGGYLGYKIKVVPKTDVQNNPTTDQHKYSAFLTYNANGGKIKGHDTYEDEENKQYSDKLSGDVYVPIIEDLPVRDGYKFVCWYEPNSYSNGWLNKQTVYNNEKNPLDTSIYSVPKGKNLTKYNLLTGKEEERKTKEIFAVWDKTYQLTYDADGGETPPQAQVGTFGLDMSNMTQQKTDKKLQVAPAIAKNGFEFKGWKAEDGKVYQAGDEFIIKFAAPEQKLTAVWERTTQPQPPVVPPAPNPVTPPVTPVTPQPQLQPQQLTPQPSTLQPSAGNGEPEVSAGHKTYTVAKTGETKAFSVSLSLVILALTALAALKRRAI